MRTIQIPTDDLETVSRSLLTIAHALRGLKDGEALTEVGAIYTCLAGVLGQPVERLRSEAPAPEEARGIAFLAPSALSHPKVWEKVVRRFEACLDAFSRGDLSQALPALAALELGLVALPNHRAAFAAERGLPATLPSRVAGGDVEERARVFVTPSLRRLGPRVPDLETVTILFRRAEGLGEGAQRHLAEGRYGEAAQGLNRALAVDPGLGERRLLLGELLRRLDRGAEAEGELFFMIEQELVLARLSQGAHERLLSQARLARAYISLARVALGDARIPDAQGHLTLAAQYLDWVERRGSDGGLGEEDLAHLREEGRRVQRLLGRLG